MSEHLSHDQISRWIMGQSTPDEEQHGRECSQCLAELNRFSERISTFCAAMQEWSEKEVVPRLERTPSAASRQHMRQPVFRWALLGMTFAILVGIPIYQHRNDPTSISESEANSPTDAAIHTATSYDDVLLMQSVTMHLSRPIPMPMERVMALLPVEAERPGSPDGFERKETR